MISPLIKINEIEHSKEYFDELQLYNLKLEEKGLPIIYSLSHLCLLAEVNIKSIVDLCLTDRQASYKRFKLRKKRGGFRVIQTPNDELRYLQRWILINILNKVNSHESCKGFDPETSIKLNAVVHLNSSDILKMDLLRFYD